MNCGLKTYTFVHSVKGNAIIGHKLLVVIINDKS